MSIYFLETWVKLSFIRNSWLFRGKQDGRCTYYHWQYHTSLSPPLLNMVQWSDIFAIVFPAWTTLWKLGFRSFVFNLLKVFWKWKSWIIIRGAWIKEPSIFTWLNNGCLLSLCQNETIYVNMCSLYRLIFMQIKQIFIWKKGFVRGHVFKPEAQGRSEMAFLTNDIEGTPPERPLLWSLSQICASIKVYVNFP